MWANLRDIKCASGVALAVLTVSYAGVALSAENDAIYKNEEYAFSIKNTNMSKACLDRDNVSLHGLVLVLNEKSCSNTHGGPRFILSGYWNIQEAENAHEVAEKSCAGRPFDGGQLKLAGLDVVECGPYPSDNGLVEKDVFAQRASKDGSVSGRINYELTAYCLPTKVALCEAAIRDIVSSISTTPMR
jgi:hypothetical protein